VRGLWYPSPMARKKAAIKLPPENLIPAVSKPVRPFPFKKVAIIVVILGLVAIFVSNKGLLLAAVVNGRPIFRWQLNSVMVGRYGVQTLDGMISQVLIDAEARKGGVAVSQTDIAKKESELLASLGGNVSIDEVLQYQGMTKADFEDQLRLQLTVEKLLGKDITITDAEIENYIATSGSTLAATDEAGMREEAKQAIFSKEINDKLQTWFSGIKTKASILRFL
jgi:SurA N-terminal domain